MPASSRDHVPLFRIMIDGPGPRPGRGELRARDQDHELAAAARRLHAPGRLSRQARRASRSSRSTTPSSRSARSSRSSWARRARRRRRPLFKGEIVTVEPDFHAGGVAMVVRAYDKTAPHDAHPQAALVHPVDVLGHRQDGLQRERAPRRRDRERRQLRLRPPAQRDRLGLRLAPGQRIGFELTVDAGKAEVRAAQRQRREGRAQPTRTTCTRFRPRITAVQQVETVNVRGFDFKTKRSVVRHQVRARSRSPRPASPARRWRASSPGRCSRSRASPSPRTGEADSMAQAALDQLANAYLAAEGDLRRRPAHQGGGPAEDQRASAELLGHLPRREVRPRASAAAAATRRSSPTPPASTACSASPPAPTAARGHRQLDRRRRRDQQQRPRDARPREGLAPVVERRRVLLGAGAGSPRRERAGHLDAPPARRAGDRRLRERRPLLSRT